MHINEGKGKIALFSTKDNVLLSPHPSYSSATDLFSLFDFTFYFSFPSSVFYSLLHNFIVFPPPPPHCYCFPSFSSFLLFSLLLLLVFLLLLHIKIELTNENVSYFLTNQSKTKGFIDLKVTRKPKLTKNSTRPYLYEIPGHFTHEIKTKGYDVLGANLFHFKLMKFHFKKKA